MRFFDKSTKRLFRRKENTSCRCGSCWNCSKIEVRLNFRRAFSNLFQTRSRSLMFSQSISALDFYCFIYLSESVVLWVRYFSKIVKFSLERFSNWNAVCSAWSSTLVTFKAIFIVTGFWSFSGILSIAVNSCSFLKISIQLEIANPPKLQSRTRNSLSSKMSTKLECCRRSRLFSWLRILITVNANSYKFVSVFILLIYCVGLVANNCCDKGLIF